MTDEQTSTTEPADTPAADKEIVIRPGGGASWDDFEGMEETVEAEQAKEVEAEAEKAVAVTEAASTKLEEKATEKKVDAAVEALKGEGLDARAGDASGEIKVKVDGQVVTVTLDELKTNYSGKVAWDKRFRELETERQAFRNDQKLLDENLKLIAQTATQDPVKALEILARQIGESPEQLMTRLIEKGREFAELSDDEVQTKIQTSKFEAEKQRLERDRADLQRKQQVQELESYADAKKAETGFSTEDIQTAHKVLEDAGKLKDISDPKQIIDTVFDYTETWKVYETVEKAALEVDPELNKDDNFIHKIADVVDSDFTVDDVVDIIKQVKGISSNGAEEHPEKEKADVAEERKEVKESPSKKEAKSKKDSDSKSESAQSEKKKTVKEPRVKDFDSKEEFMKAMEEYAAADEDLFF